MAGPARLELATSGVTGRRSNRLNYDPRVSYIIPHYSLNTFMPMISFREYCQLDEAFTDPLPIKVTSHSASWKATFTVPGKPRDRKFEIEFNKIAYGAYKNTGLTIPKELHTSDIAWELTFGDITVAKFAADYELTGGGQAFTVFATVIHALKMFVRKEGRPFIYFSAKEASRQKLYDRFVRLVARTVPGMHGFKMADTQASREILGSRGGGSSYVIVPKHIPLKTVVGLIDVWHKKTAKAASEFLTGL